MSDDASDKNWKLKLRYGKLKTPFQHFTLIADGVVTGDLKGGFSCRPGLAFIAMKMWAPSEKAASNMIQTMGKAIGFVVTGEPHVYTTEPTAPPKAKPHAYDVRFTPYDREERAAEEPADRVVH
jgi:hypothetical protein